MGRVLHRQAGPCPAVRWLLSDTGTRLTFLSWHRWIHGASVRLKKMQSTQVERLIMGEINKLVGEEVGPASLLFWWFCSAFCDALILLSSCWTEHYTLRSTFVSGLRAQVWVMSMSAYICIHHLRKPECRSCLSSVHRRTLCCRARGAYVRAVRLLFVCAGAALSSIRAVIPADEHPLCGKCYKDKCGVDPAEREAEPSASDPTLSPC